jgi:general stress protein 26
MKLLIKSIWLTLSILMLLPSHGLSQKSESTDSLKNELINAAREIMTSVNTCALITIDYEGSPRVRVMDPFLPENDFTVWFGTNPKSRKVDQIKNNPKVTLYYLDSDESGYVTIHGIARIVNDRVEKDKRWKDEWEAFYQNKTNDYLLIKVSPEWMEVISYSRGIFGDSITWEPPAVIFDSK